MYKCRESFIKWWRPRRLHHWRRTGRRRSRWGSGRRDTCQLVTTSVANRKKKAKLLSQVWRVIPGEDTRRILSLGTSDRLTFWGPTDRSRRRRELEAARIIEHSRRTQMPRRKQHAPQRMKCKSRQVHAQAKTRLTAKVKRKGNLSIESIRKRNKVVFSNFSNRTRNNKLRC